VVWLRGSTTCLPRRIRATSTPLRQGEIAQGPAHHTGPTLHGVVENLAVDLAQGMDLHRERRRGIGRPPEVSSTPTVESASIPTERNSTSTGTPSRAENLLEAMTSSSSTPASSTAVLIHTAS
jgi:hypothetical protein